MRILVVGTGGVGSAFAAIAQRRSFFDRITLADLDVSRPQSVVDRLGEPDRFAAARDRRVEPGVDRRADPGGEGRRRAERDRPAVQPTDLRRLPRGRGDVSRHGRDALAAAPRAALLRDGREARRLPVRKARELGAGRAGWRSSGSASSPAPPTCSRATRPTSCSPRSTRSGSATAPTSSSRATTSRPRSRSGRRSRSASTHP